MVAAGSRRRPTSIAGSRTFLNARRARRTSPTMQTPTVRGARLLTSATRPAPRRAAVDQPDAGAHALGRRRPDRPTRSAFRRRVDDTLQVVGAARDASLTTSPPNIPQPFLYLPPRPGGGVRQRDAVGARLGWRGSVTGQAIAHIARVVRDRIRGSPRSTTSGAFEPDLRTTARRQAARAQPALSPRSGALALALAAVGLHGGCMIDATARRDATRSSASGLGPRRDAGSACVSMVARDGLRLRRTAAHDRRHRLCLRRLRSAARARPRRRPPTPRSSSPSAQRSTPRRPPRRPLPPARRAAALDTGSSRSCERRAMAHRRARLCHYRDASAWR